MFAPVPAIKNKPVRNEDPKDAKLREYQAEIERLRALIEQRRVHERRPRKPPRQRSQPALSDNCQYHTDSRRQFYMVPGRGRRAVGSSPSDQVRARVDGALCSTRASNSCQRN